jgi:glucose/arabinose dehydrogenase
MTMSMKSTLSILLTAVALSACSSMNVFKDSPQEPAPPPMAAEPEQPMVPKGKLSAAQIKSALSGKSWKWSGPNNSGVTLYANDGSSLVEVTGKGTTTGKWVAKDGQLCESFSPAPFLPKGVPLTCQPMTGAGGTYKVGQTTFTLA